jgi:molecular chaperone DnaJ
VRDYYEVLDVAHDATPDEIRRSYRSLALQFHPDRNSGSRDAEERFKELAEAFHTLSDPERRRVYDIWGADAPARRTLVDANGANLDDAVSVFVQQFSAFVQEELPEMSDFVDIPASVPSLPLRVRVSLAEVATGVCKEVPLPCVRCSGTGRRGPGPTDGACPTCEGRGEDAAGETVLVDVPAGALAGDCVRVPRAGRGDLLAFVEVEEDPRFVRAGADVVLELPISARGGPGSEVEVPTPTGSTLIKIPQGTPLGGALRIPGQGLPARSRPGRGDLIVKLVEDASDGAVPLPTPARTRAVVRPTASKVVTAGLAFLLGGVTVGLLGRFGSEDATTGLAASTDRASSTASASRMADGVEKPDPSRGASAEAPGTRPVDNPPALRIPSAPDLTGVSLPQPVDIEPTYSDQPIASLTPIRPEPRPTDASGSNASGPSLPAITQVPRVLNADKVHESLEREYPVGLREAKIGGRVEMRFDIDAQGRVERFQISGSSGNNQLDAAATRVARVFSFSPALRGSERVATSVSLGIVFGESAAAQTGAGASAPRAIARGPNDPVPADFEVAPQVSNPDRVRQALLREYPIGLRDAGIGGDVDMWFYVNQQGVVERFQIRQGSGRGALDEAAMRVAPAFRFTPARRADQPIATWISFRISFVGANPNPG